jgi:hypothetical protein
VQEWWQVVFDVLLLSLLLLVQLRADNERLRAAAAAGRGSAGGAVPGAAVEATGAALHRQVRNDCATDLTSTSRFENHAQPSGVDGFAWLCHVFCGAQQTAPE